MLLLHCKTSVYIDKLSLAVVIALVAGLIVMYVFIWIARRKEKRREAKQEAIEQMNLELEREYLTQMYQQLRMA